MTGTPSAKAGAPFRWSLEDTSRIPREDSFNGALYSLKAFSIATTLVIAGGAASVWGVKVYLGVKDTQEFASAMRLTILNKWPLLTSRIHRSSGDSPTPPSLWPRAPAPSATARTDSDSPDGPPPTSGPVPDVIVDGSRWSWPAVESRLAEAYERGGITQFAEAAVGELEAELELERHKRGLVDSDSDSIQVQK